MMLMRSESEPWPNRSPCNNYCLYTNNIISQMTLMRGESEPWRNRSPCNSCRFDINMNTVNDINMERIEAVAGLPDSQLL
jgi:hypothetical protein